MTLLDLWKEWWAWMKAYGIPLLPYQEQLIKGMIVSADKYTPEQLAYVITEHYEHLKEKPSCEIGVIIDAYKRKKMGQWGYPDWGYKDVKKSNVIGRTTNV